MTPDQIIQIVDILKNDGVIILPSESCYSISSLASSAKAVERIHKIKFESQDKPSTILVNVLDQLDNFGILNNIALKLSHKFHPGQLNLIIEKANNTHDYLSNDGIAFRIPKLQIMQQVIGITKEPITTTSANIHGQPSIYAEGDLYVFDGKVDYILRHGDLDKNILVSTVYDTRSRSIIRHGDITLEQINDVI